MIDYRVVRPLLHRLDPEWAHRAAITALKLGLVRTERAADDPVLACRVWGLDYANPIGLAAGFDKDAEVVDAMLGLGFGFVEAGSVTPRPQPGNPRPRLFRLNEDAGVINRFGFNSGGLDVFAARLARRRRLTRSSVARRAPAVRGIVGANVGKNKDTEDAAADYAAGIEAVCGLADYLVCNVSSPNTPGLRGLQARAPIERLFVRVLEARRRSAPDREHPPPLLAKVGPDLTEEQLHDIAEVAVATGIDGLIVGNTTVTRPPGLRSRHRGELGGLSGRPLGVHASACLAAMYRYTRGRLPLIGCGGIASGADAYARIRAGAHLVQLYSALVFEGPGLVQTIKADLARLLRADGFANVADAVGIDQDGRGDDVRLARNSAPSVSPHVKT
ncbi:MAG: quinone-dependent dihydroorotate dehydrogenase [Burkholderiales bacterium]|nr:quinone-dependent dihydroorotate dehydrogenase [Burkholderiales bacterium]